MPGSVAVLGVVEHHEGGRGDRIDMVATEIDRRHLCSRRQDWRPTPWYLTGRGAFRAVTEPTSEHSRHEKDPTAMDNELIPTEADRIALRIVAGFNDAITDDDGGEQFGALIEDVFGEKPTARPGEVMLALGRRLLVHYRDRYGAEAVGSVLAAELVALARR